MSTITMNYSSNIKFDVVEYIKKLRNAGVKQELAELQAQELEHVLDIAVNASKEEFKAKDLASKGDLRETELRLQKEIIQAKNQTLVWTFGMLAGFAAFLLGAMAKGFHWW